MKKKLRSLEEEKMRLWLDLIRERRKGRFCLGETDSQPLGWPKMPQGRDRAQEGL